MSTANNQYAQDSSFINSINYHETGEHMVIDQQNDELCMSGYSTYGNVQTTPQPEIINDIQKISIPTEVISEAINIFYEISKTSKNKVKSIKGTRKTKLIFYCVFMAFDKLDSLADPCYIADIIGLKRNSIEQSFNEFSPTGITIIKPEKMIKFYIHSLNKLLLERGVSYDENTVIDGVIKVIEMCRGTNAGKEWTQNTSANVVVISSLYFYMNDIMRFDISNVTNLFEQACYISWACIRRYHGQVSKYYNADKNGKYEKIILD